MQELNKRILIIGGLGFLGVNLTEKLLQMKIKPYLVDIFPESIFDNNAFIPFNLEDVNYYKINLNEKEELKKILKAINPEIIVHAAALTNLSREYEIAIKTIEINIKGSLNLLEAIKELNQPKLIFLSTSDIYGEVDPPFKESQIAYPASPYSISKLACENYCNMYSNIYSFPLIILRIFNIFGKYQQTTRLIPHLITEILQNKPVDLTPGEQKREYNYIENIIDAIIISMQKDQLDRKIFNIGSGHSFKIKDVALRIAEILNKKELLRLGALPYRENEIWDMYCDNTLASESLGWKPKIEFSEGIEKTIQWYQGKQLEESKK